MTQKTKSFLFYWFMIAIIVTGGISGVMRPSRLSEALGWLITLGWFINSDRWQKLATENLKQLQVVSRSKGGPLQ